MTNTQDRRFIYDHSEACDFRQQVNRPWTDQEKAEAVKAASDFEPINDSYTATMIAEGVEEASEERQIEAWQFLIDTGLCWRLQGWFGRRARDLINTGVCHPAE